MNNICPTHGIELKQVPAGVSKSTGRPYNAFMACPVRGCQYRPAKSEGGGGAGRGRNDALITRQVAFKGAIDLVVAGKVEISQLEAVVDKLDRIINKAPTQPTPPAQAIQVPTPQESVPTIQIGDDVEQDYPDMEDIPF